MDPGLYQGLKNDLLVMNKEDMVLNYMEGMPMISQKHTLLNQNVEPGNLFNFDLYWYETLFGIELNRPWATGRIHLI
jgi:hypothetical protein